MKQLLEGIENQQLAQFTVLLSSLLQAKKAAGKGSTFNLDELITFAATNDIDHMGQPQRSRNVGDLKISDSNRDSIMAQAERDARSFAEARNKRTQPANLTEFDQTLVGSVKSWVASKNNKLRGKK